MVSRRHFISGSLAVAGTGLATAAWARWGELHWVEYVEHALPLAALPDGLDGQLLVQLSDLHVGPDVSDHFLRKTFEEVAGYRPAFVAYTGDFLTWDGPEQVAQLGRLLPHAPRGSSGTVAVLGNHDYGHHWSDRTVAAAVERHLEENGITVLRNTSRVFDGLQFVGFEDLWSPLFGGPAVLPQRDSARPTIVLCHNPDACDLDIWHDYDGWILSGHTHGGQVDLPVIGAPLVPVRNKRYVSGEYALTGGRHLYINRALGHALAVRLGARPEVTLHRMQRA